MPSINDTLTTFTTALQQNETIVCDKKGAWRKASAFETFLDDFAWQKTARIKKIGEMFCAALDHFERKPLIFSDDVKIQQAQKSLCDTYLTAASAVTRLLDSTSGEFRTIKSKIDQRVTALKYRMLPNCKANQDEVIDQNVYIRLLVLAEFWKDAHPLNVSKELSPKELLKLAQAVAHPDFAELLLKNESIRNEFFNWILRENNAVIPFMQFPATVERLKTALISTRVGRFGGNHLQIELRNQLRTDTNCRVQEKIVTLPFYTDKVEQISILDESQEVNLEGWKLTIKKVLDLFAIKRVELGGDLEYFGTTGITNWHSFKMGKRLDASGSYSQIDFSHPKWWEALPAVEILTADQIMHKYEVNLKAGEWLATYSATRQAPLLTFEGHSYIQVFIPDGDGRYKAYAFGDYPVKYPTGLEVLSFLCDTVAGKWQYPDENIMMANRQQAHHPVVMTPELGIKKMEVLKRHLQRFHIYQLGHDNCAKYVQDIYQETLCAKDDRRKSMPNFFQLKILQTEPSDPFFGTFFALFRKVSSAWQPTLLAVFDRLLGSHRGRVVQEDGKLLFKSVATHPLRNAQAILLPSHLHKQIINNRISGILTFGH